MIELLMMTPEQTPTNCRLGTVTEISGVKVKVKFDGEADAGEKAYTRLTSYSPTVGDRVLLIRYKNDYIAIGAIAR